MGKVLVVSLTIASMGSLCPSLAVAAESEVAGDANCDGRTDLADAVFILNWLFLGGPEVCPVANGPELRARISELETALDAKTTEADQCQENLVASQAEAIAALQDLLACRGSLTDTQTDLAAAESARDLCQETLAQVNPDLATCVADLAASEASLTTCIGDLTVKTQELAQTQAALAAAEARITELEQENAALDAALAMRGLPATGQTRCYDEAGNEISCDSAEWPGQDGFYQAGCPSEGRFVDNQDGTASDSCTGLMWQKDTADVNGDGSIGDGDRLNWQSALKYCDGLSFAGHDDWRLPNIRELQSIIDSGGATPVFAPVFQTPWTGGYWSSTSKATRESVFGVSCGDGDTGGYGKTGSVYILAVRTIQPGE